MPGNLPTELQSNTKDWFSSNDKDLRDAVKSVVSRYGFALNTQLLDFTASGTLDVRYSLFLCDANLGPIGVSLPVAAAWGTNKAGCLIVANRNGPNNVTLTAATGETIIGYTTATTLVIAPGEVWELLPDYSGAKWYAFRKQVQGYSENIWTPTILAGTGTITTSSASGNYTKIGRVYFWNVTITITTNGTGGSYVSFTLPAVATQGGVCYGRADNVSGKMLQGKWPATATAAAVFGYDNSYPGSNGEVLKLSGFSF